MGQLALANGGFAVVDDSDIGRLSGYRWFAQMSHRERRCPWLYVARFVPGHGAVTLHHQVLGFDPSANVGMVIDHRDGDGLNNSRSNLRICTQTENKRNRRKFFGRSRYKGVTHEPSSPRDITPWRARIRVNGRKVCLGRHATELRAALAYDLAAKQQYGDFARVNLGVSRLEVPCN